MSSLKDRIRNEQASGGFRRIAPGLYEDVVIESVTSKQTEAGRSLWELRFRTTDDQTGKFTVWYNSCDEITDTESENRYIKAMGRLCRLFTDLGLKEPDGETHKELEADAYERLGEFTGRRANAVVQEDRRKANEVIVFLNAPTNALPGAPVSSAQAPTAPPASAFSGTSPNIDTIPFFRRDDLA